jgi:hypothetical protein
LPEVKEYESFYLPQVRIQLVTNNLMELFVLAQVEASKARKTGRATTRRRCGHEKLLF